MKSLTNTTLALMAFSVSACAGAPTIQTPYQGRVIEFRSGPEGFDTRTFFYEGQHEVVAFDAQFTPDLAQKSIAHLRTFTQKPIRWLVITHPNPDKFNGASIFQAEGARILSSQQTAKAIPGVQAYKEYFFVEMAKMFKKGEYPQPTPVDQTFEGQTELVLQGGERIELRELSKPGVSSTQTVAFLPSMKVLFVGDLVHNEAHAWLEGGIVNGKPTATIDGWMADLKELESLYPANTKVYGGRGVQADLQTSVRNQTKYLKAAVQLIDANLKTLGAKAKDFNGANAGALYKSLAAEFQRKFPQHELAYMIEYGAYGLVQNRMQK